MTIDKTLDSKVTVSSQYHKSKKNNNWLETEIYSAINDSRSTIPHEQVMRDMDIMINKLMLNHK